MVYVGKYKFLQNDMSSNKDMFIIEGDIAFSAKIKANENLLSISSIYFRCVWHNGRGIVQTTKNFQMFKVECGAHIGEIEKVICYSKLMHVEKSG